MSTENSNRTKWLRVEFALNLVNHVFIGFVTIYMSWLCIKLGLRKTSLHVWLCTLGLFEKNKDQNKALGGTLGIVGGIVKFCQSSVHFETIHGKFGLAALIICTLSMLSGLSALYSQSLQRLVQPLLNKTVHNFLGIAGFVLAMCTICFGYDTIFFQDFVGTGSFPILMQVLTIYSIVFCCWGPLKAFWVKCKFIKENF